MSESSDSRKTKNTKTWSVGPGRIGVFWVYAGRPLAKSVSLGNGMSGPVAVDSPFDHVTVWSEFQQREPRLVSLEYEQVPRGRVLFLKRERKFVVYLDKVLAVPAVKKAILKEFKLRASTTRFAADPHYTTDPAELDRLLGPD